MVLCPIHKGASLHRTTSPSIMCIISSNMTIYMHVQEALRIASTEETGSSNAFGDHQLVADMTTEAIIESELRRCPGVHSMSSEESPVNTVVSSEGIYSVAFDPLDGSSIIPSNFAVGYVVYVKPFVVGHAASMFVS